MLQGILCLICQARSHTRPYLSFFLSHCCQGLPRNATVFTGQNWRHNQMVLSNQFFTFSFNSSTLWEVVMETFVSILPRNLHFRSSSRVIEISKVFPEALAITTATEASCPLTRLEISELLQGWQQSFLKCSRCNILEKHLVQEKGNCSPLPAIWVPWLIVDEEQCHEAGATGQEELEGMTHSFNRNYLLKLCYNISSNDDLLNKSSYKVSKEIVYTILPVILI